MPKKNAGFSSILIIIIVLVVGALAAAILFAPNRDKPRNSGFGPPDKRDRKSSEKICLMKEKYAAFDYPKLSIPFKIEDFSNAHWGFIPFCAYLKNVNQTHNAFDFEIKKDAPILASAGGVAEYLEQTDAIGAGEVLKINGDGFSLDYSGLTRLQVADGETVKRGDLLGYAFRTPYDEYHVHLGIFIDGNARCPLQYYDEEFLRALDEILSKSDWANYTDATCACNCEIMMSKDR